MAFLKLESTVHVIGLIAHYYKKKKKKREENTTITVTVTKHCNYHVIY